MTIPVKDMVEKIKQLTKQLLKQLPIILVSILVILITYSIYQAAYNPNEVEGRMVKVMTGQTGVIVKTNEPVKVCVLMVNGLKVSWRCEKQKKKISFVEFRQAFSDKNWCLIKAGNSWIKPSTLNEDNLIVIPSDDDQRVIYGQVVSGNTGQSLSGVVVIDEYGGGAVAIKTNNLGRFILQMNVGNISGIKAMTEFGEGKVIVNKNFNWDRIINIVVVSD